jgi:hypothetical protein
VNTRLGWLLHTMVAPGILNFPKRPLGIFRAAFLPGGRRIITISNKRCDASQVRTIPSEMAGTAVKAILGEIRDESK